jgi:hypothetical protein
MIDSPVTGAGVLCPPWVKAGTWHGQDSARYQFGSLRQAWAIPAVLEDVFPARLPRPVPDAALRAGTETCSTAATIVTRVTYGAASRSIWVNLRQIRRLRVHLGPNRPILRPFALSTPEVHRRYTGCTRDLPVYLRCASGVPPVYTLWEPLRPGGFAEGLPIWDGVSNQIKTGARQAQSNRDQAFFTLKLLSLQQARIKLVG